MISTIRGTKEEATGLRWLQKAQSKKGDRPVLEAFHRLDGLTVTADGFRLHIIPTPNCLVELPNTNSDQQANYTGKIPTGAFVTDLEGLDSHYPNVEALIPNGQPTHEFAINPKYLREALEGLDETAIVKLYADSNCITVQGTCDQERYALIMRQHYSNGIRTWEPKFKKEVIQNGDRG